MFLLLTSILFSIFLLYKLVLAYIHGNNDYWLKQGVPRALSTEAGSYYQILTGKAKLHDVDLYYYNKYKKQDVPYVGIMEMRSPVLQVRDLELLKRIFIKDFEHFVNRRSFTLGEAKMSDNFLFNMTNQPWKDLRTVMSPTFTTGKIRRMFQHFDKCGSDLVQYVNLQNDRNGGHENGLNIRELFGRYTMDVISSAAFGMDSKCLLSDDSYFMKMGRSIQKFDFVRTMKLFCLIFLPKLAKWVDLNVFSTEAMNFFKGIVRNTMKRRSTNNGGNYHDFLQLMMESRMGDENSGGNQIVDDDDGTDDSFEKDAELKSSLSASASASARSSIKISDDAILANSITFFLAGFDTTESLMSFITYHLALYPEMQERLRREIIECVEETDGKVTYEAMNKMTYLEMFLSEVLRRYPPATRTERRVTKPYTIPDTNITLPTDMVVAIPIYGIHMDEKYYPEPEKFDPERFSPENKAKRSPYAFMPFGHGPRNCIGMRFALFETKAAIAQLVKNFELLPCAETPFPIALENISGNLKAAEHVKIAFKRLEVDT